MNLPETAKLQEIYGETEISGARFKNLADNFSKIYGQDKAEYFTAPGRTEIIGNHTDHNGGKVIAGSINLDTIGAAYPNGTQVIRITSEGYDKEVVVDINDLASVPKAQGTVSLVAGMVEAIQKFGFKVAGFDAYVTTNVIRAAGVSSSASFEMLVCSIINYFFNDNRMTSIDYAKIGRYAENHFWNKQSGLMDQLACAAGGMIFLDFSNSDFPCVEKTDPALMLEGYDILLVNTGKGHGDLSAEYSDVPLEMKNAAKQMGKNLLCEAKLPLLLDKLPEIRAHCGDRSFLRSLHFYEENERVQTAKEAIRNGNTEELLALIGLSLIHISEPTRH